MAKETSKNISDAAGVIRAGESYLLDDFKKRTKLGKAAYLSARRNGLITIHIHGRTFVRGEDWLRYLEAQIPNYTKAKHSIA